MSSEMMDSAPLSIAQAIDVIWEEALLHLHLTNNEILLPLNIIETIGPQSVNEIKARLCARLRAPVVGFVDDSMNTFRIMRTPLFVGSSVNASHIRVPMLVDDGTPESQKKKSSKKKSAGKKSSGEKNKVPRPANSFILYRQYYQPIILQQQPELRNCQVSGVVGNMWNNESDEVKAHFKSMADEIKRKHKEDHPDYQYAPRKPSEKKHRNSSRKNDDSNNQQDENTPEIAGDITLTDEQFTIVEVPEPPELNLDFLDFDFDEYQNWLDRAEHVQV